MSMHTDYQELEEERNELFKELMLVRELLNEERQKKNNTLQLNALEILKDVKTQIRCLNFVYRSEIVRGYSTSILRKQTDKSIIINKKADELLSSIQDLHILVDELMEETK